MDKEAQIQVIEGDCNWGSEHTMLYIDDVLCTFNVYNVINHSHPDKFNEKNSCCVCMCVPMLGFFFFFLIGLYGYLHVSSISFLLL